MAQLPLYKQILRDHKPRKSSNGVVWCAACPQEDWGHRDFGPATAPCEPYKLAQEIEQLRSKQS